MSWFIKKRQQKTAEISVRFTLDRLGHVLSVEIEKGSGDKVFDEAALAMVRRLQRGRLAVVERGELGVRHGGRRRAPSTCGGGGYSSPAASPAASVSCSIRAVPDWSRGKSSSPATVQQICSRCWGASKRMPGSSS